MPVSLTAAAEEADNESSENDESIDGTKMLLIAVPSGISSPSPSHSSSNESNSENHTPPSDLFSSPPRNQRVKPMNTPPPSLFKTDIVDSIVEQHEMRESAQRLDFSDEENGPNPLSSVVIVNQSPN